jgi:hypothetical protein
MEVVGNRAIMGERAIFGSDFRQKIGFAERSGANYGRGYADILPNGIPLFSDLENER